MTELKKKQASRSRLYIYIYVWGAGCPETPPPERVFQVGRGPPPVGWGLGWLVVSPPIPPVKVVGLAGWLVRWLGVLEKLRQIMRKLNQNSRKTKVKP